MTTALPRRLTGAGRAKSLQEMEEQLSRSAPDAGIAAIAAEDPSLLLEPMNWQTAFNVASTNRMPARVIQEASWRSTLLQFAGALGWMRTLAVALKAGIKADDDVIFGGRAPLTPRIAFLGRSYYEMPSAKIVQLALKHGQDPNRPIRIDTATPAAPLLNIYADVISDTFGRPASVVADSLRAMQALMQHGANTFESVPAGHGKPASVTVVQAIAMAPWLSTSDQTQTAYRPARKEAAAWKLMPELEDVAMQTMRLAVARGASTTHQAWSDEPLLATAVRNGRVRAAVELIALGAGADDTLMELARKHLAPEGLAQVTEAVMRREMALRSQPPTSAPEAAASTVASAPRRGARAAPCSAARAPALPARHQLAKPALGACENGRSEGSPKVHDLWNLSSQDRDPAGEATGVSRRDQTGDPT